MQQSKYLIIKILISNKILYLFYYMNKILTVNILSKIEVEDLSSLFPSELCLFEFLK